MPSAASTSRVSQVPSSPLMASTASSRVSGWMAWPSTARMISPTCKPASWAGLPAVTPTISSPSDGSWLTVTPMPT